jgi:OFA family oxalate/formate antiporter-like MFS transporter
MSSAPHLERIPALWPFKRAFYGWGVVATSVLVSFAQVPMYGPVLSVFVKPIGDETGWSRSEISIAFTLGSLFGSLISVIVGRLLDRAGARSSVVVAGMVVTAVLVGLALMQEVWQFWILFGVGRTAALAGINLGTSVAVANWFVRKRARAASFLGIGLRTGQAVFPLFIAPIVVYLSWRHAYAFLAVLAFTLIVIPGWLFIRRRPEDFGLHPDGDDAEAARAPGSVAARDLAASFSLPEARRTVAFWLLTVASMTVVFAQTAVNLHAVASLQDRGVGGGFAGIFVFLFAGTAALSALGWGVVMDRWHVRWGTIAATLFSGVSMAVLIMADNLPMAVAFALLFGLGTGGWTIAQTVLFANYFGRRHLGAIRGYTQMIAAPVGAFGPLLAGWVKDTTDSYTVALSIFLVAQCVVALSLFAARQPVRRAVAEQPAD